jgi:hypothetical protein
VAGIGSVTLIPREVKEEGTKKEADIAVKSEAEAPTLDTFTRPATIDNKSGKSSKRAALRTSRIVVAPTMLDPLAEAIRNLESHTHTLTVR